MHLPEAWQIKTPSVRFTQQPLEQSLLRLQSAAQMQSLPMQPHAVGFLSPVVSWQQSASELQVSPTITEQLEVSAHQSSRSQTLPPVVTSAQQPLRQSVPVLHAAVQTVPRP
jgi:hypothetical protein